MMSIYCDTVCFAPRKETLTLGCFHLTKTPRENTTNEPTTRPLYGGGVSKIHLYYHHQLGTDGSWRESVLPLTGWVASRHLRLSWNSCPVNATDCASYRIAPASPTDWNAPLCASCSTVQTRKRRPQRKIPLKRTQMVKLSKHKDKYPVSIMIWYFCFWFFCTALKDFRIFGSNFIKGVLS